MLLLGQLSAGVLAVGISTADYADPQPNIQQHWTVALVLGIVWFCFCGCSVLGVLYQEDVQSIPSTVSLSGCCRARLKSALSRRSAQCGRATLTPPPSGT